MDINYFSLCVSQLKAGFQPATDFAMRVLQKKYLFKIDIIPILKGLILLWWDIWAYYNT